jgi:tRNA U34 5-carboxymethylaminomethyl modifying GTPase MnmE/TrmE
MAVNPLQDVVDRVANQQTVVAEEVRQFAEYAETNQPIDPAQLRALADAIDANTEQIRSIVPQVTPPPTP